jgi:hypothetical protein
LSISNRLLWLWWDQNLESVLSELAVPLSKKKGVQKLLAWHQTLPILSSRKRSDLLRDIAALMPLIHTLGGEDALVQILHSVEEVCAWWP